jgi:hypothetical protein
MTPDERFERIEQTLASMAERHREHEERHREHQEWLRENDKRHEGFRQNQESWMLDHERWTRGHEQWKVEIESRIRELHASQQVTEERLQRLIRALSGTRETNGHA